MYRSRGNDGVLYAEKNNVWHIVANIFSKTIVYVRGLENFVKWEYVLFRILSKTENTSECMEVFIFVLSRYRWMGNLSNVAFCRYRDYELLDEKFYRRFRFSFLYETMVVYGFS